ncbi:MAG: hypothetical protein WAX69_23730 [Victivallales bacterium]
MTFPGGRFNALSHDKYSLNYVRSVNRKKKAVSAAPLDIYPFHDKELAVFIKGYLDYLIKTRTTPDEGGEIEK